jgi:flagella basal body P-ring formation protein FlgA
MNNLIKIIIICFSFTAAMANATDKSITISGRENATVTLPIVKLSDISEITSARVQDDDTILALNRIQIASNLSPGESLSLSAHDIIERIRVAGVNISEIGYRFPRIVIVKRAARGLSKTEVIQAIEEFIHKSEPDASVRQVSGIDNAAIAVNAKIIEVIPSPMSDGAQQKYTLKIGADELSAQRVSVTAHLDRWAEVAVVRIPVAKGEIVDASNLAMARLNVQSLPADAVSDLSKVVGLETKRNLGAGEVLQKNKLNIPTVIKVGEKVTLRFKSALLMATASGIALDAAGLQQPIRIKNDSSNKVVTGVVMAAGVVEVR